MLPKCLTDTVPHQDVAESPPPMPSSMAEGIERPTAAARLVERFEEQRRALALEIHGELEQSLALARMHLAMGRESGLDAHLAKSLQAIDNAVRIARQT